MDQVRETLDDRGQKLLTTWCSVDGDLKPCVVELVARLHERNSHGPMFEPDASLLDLRHPNIVSYLGFVETDTYYGIAAERLLGKSLREELDLQIAAKTHLPEDIIISWLKQLVEGLHFLHEENAASHGNLDASQVLLVGDGTIKIQGYGFPRSKY